MTPSTIFVVAFIEFGFYTLFQFFHAKHILLGEFSVYGISILRRAWEWEKQNKEDTFRRERERRGALGSQWESTGLVLFQHSSWMVKYYQLAKNAVTSLAAEAVDLVLSRVPRAGVGTAQLWPLPNWAGWAAVWSRVLLQSSLVFGLQFLVGGCSEAFSFWLCVEWKKTLQFLACH